MQSHTGRPPIPAGHAGDPSASQPRLNVLWPERIRVIFALTERITSGLGSRRRSSLEWLVQPGPLLLRTSAPPRSNPCRDILHMLAHNQTHLGRALLSGRTLAVYRRGFSYPAQLGSRGWSKAAPRSRLDLALCAFAKRRFVPRDIELAPGAVSSVPLPVLARARVSLSRRKFGASNLAA